MNIVETQERIAEMFRLSRKASGKSQEYVADKMGVSKKSVQNWESGMSTPNMITTFQWFDVVGVPMFPYFMGILHPLEIEDIPKDTDINKIKKAMHVYIDEMPYHTLEELLFLFFGKHGSSPDGVMDMITAYVQLPLTMRVSIAQQIVTNYEICETTGLLIENKEVTPDWQSINAYTERAKSAVKQGKKSYI